ncbi:undecaprenyl/decaprenyl-phosphate alpha-N-acetylglucosaminyl 1-phosphate transferase [Candidatus Peribacteria bacterium]|nr:undecaprenyl/decaprenyl-phosphate alpha-N-acetylglucosaminyl 1-phosphate transferase [Candidatus Peribacteria bacterium]
MAKPLPHNPETPMTMIYLFPLALLLSLTVHGVLLPRFAQWGLGDKPHLYPHEGDRAPLPYPGGVIIAVLSLGLGFLSPVYWPVVPLVLALGALSFLDDRARLPAWLRLLVQLLLAMAVVHLGVEIHTIGHPFAATNIDLSVVPWLPGVITVGWIVLITNAMNFIDGSHGLSVPLSGVGFLTMGVLGLTRPELVLDPANAPVTQGALYMAGLCAGGVYFFATRRAVLGDTGSQVLGFLLAVLSILSGAKIATTLIVLSLPIIDALIVPLRRMVILHQSPFQGDLTHMHHTLERRLSPQQVIALLTGVSLLLGTIAVTVTHSLWQLLALLLVLGGSTVAILASYRSLR